VSEVEHHVADRPLSLVEFADRAGGVPAAAGHPEITAITHDLPSLHRHPWRWRRPADLVIAFVGRWPRSPSSPDDWRRCRTDESVSRRTGGVQTRAGAVEPALADGRELFAPFPQGQRLFEGAAAGLQPFDDPGQLGPSLLIGQSLDV
jgi:hypothetical protein